jgi:hypothetical protein
MDTQTAAYGTIGAVAILAIYTTVQIISKSNCFAAWRSDHFRMRLAAGPEQPLLNSASASSFPPTPPPAIRTETYSAAV